MRITCQWFVIVVVSLAPSAVAQLTCPLPPKAGKADRGEADTAAIYNNVIIDSPTCATAGDTGCNARGKELQTLLTSAEKLRAKELDCSVNGQFPDSAGTSKSSPDQIYYAQRAALWAALIADLTPHLSDETYQIPLSVQDGFLGLHTPAPAAARVPPLIAPAIAGSLENDMVHFRVTSQPVDMNYPTSHLYICVWPAQPSSSASLDCTAKGSTVKPSELEGEDTDRNGLYVLANKSGTTDITLKSPLSAGQAVSIVEVSGNSEAVSTPSIGVAISSQCNKAPYKNPFSDCDFKFSIIGGVEQAGLSSRPSTTDGFLRVFTRAGGKGVFAWAEIRLLSAPQQDSTNGVLAAFTDPTGKIITTSVSSVGNSIDFSVGAEFEPWPQSHRYTISGIAGFGGTTPLASNSVTQAYAAPSLGTVECNVLYDKFGKVFTQSQYNIVKNSPANDLGTTGGACLLNMNAPSSGTTTTKYAPINTIGFSNQDRSNFFAKYLVGVRSVYRFKSPNTVACGDLDTVNHIAPCQRGIVDFTLGKDSSVTGGQLNSWIFKVDAVHPLPIRDTAIIYLFGSFSMRFEKDMDNNPLILQTANISQLSGTGASAVPNVNTVVLPLQQPDRDFYRFGIGVDAICIFDKIFTSRSTCLSSPQQPSNSGSPAGF